MTDFYPQNRGVCSTRSHGPLLYAFCLCFYFKAASDRLKNILKYDMLLRVGTAFSIFRTNKYSRYNNKYNKTDNNAKISCTVH